MKKVILFIILVSTLFLSERVLANQSCEDLVKKEVNSIVKNSFVRGFVIEHSLFVLSYLNESRLTENSARIFTNRKLERWVRDSDKRENLTNQFMKRILKARKTQQCKEYYQQRLYY